MKFIFLLLLLSLTYEPIWSQNRIIGGQNVTTISDFPFMVYVKAAHGKSVCGGSIISEKWAVTAAHCFMKIGKAYTLADYEIISGDSYIGDNPSRIASSRKTHSISEYYMHEKFFDHRGNDVAVFQVDPLFTFSASSSPIKLPSSEKDEDVTIARATGWGCTQRGQPGVSDLKYAWLKRTGEKKCAKEYKHIKDEDSVLCFGYGEDVPGNPGNTCSGDSGSPLINNDTIIIGVVSKGGKNKPTLYTSIFYYRDWIKEKTGI